MDRYNTQLPEVKPVPPRPAHAFSGRHVWGYVFVVLSFLLAVTFIYMMQYGRTPQQSQVCIQVVTPAKNLRTGEVKDFPTPCDVPEGWEPLKTDILPVNPSEKLGDFPESPYPTVEVVFEKYGLNLPLPKGWLAEISDYNDHSGKIDVSFSSPAQVKLREGYLKRMQPGVPMDCCPDYYTYTLSVTPSPVSYDEVAADQVFTNRNHVEMQFGRKMKGPNSEFYFTNHNGRHFSFAVLKENDGNAEELKLLLEDFWFSN